MFRSNGETSGWSTARNFVIFCTKSWLSGYNRIMRRRRAQSTVRWILSIAAIVAVLAVGGLLGLRYLRPLVVITEAVEGPVVQAFYSTWTIQPLREYPIKSNVPGVIVEVKV